MDPLAHDGDLVLARRRTDYALGDLVVYERRGGKVMHRLVEGGPSEGWISKGDNYRYPDPWKIPDSSILGEILLITPGGGRPLQALVDHPAALVMFPVGLTVLGHLPVPRRKSRRVRRLIDLTVPEAPTHPVDPGTRVALGLTVVGSMVCGAALAVAMVREAPWWPVVGIRVASLLGCLACLQLLLVRAFDGFGLPEPERTQAVFSGWCRSLPAGTEFPRGVGRPGPKDLPSARALRDKAARTRLPIFHRADAGHGQEEYLLLTRRTVYRWRPPVPGLHATASAGGPFRRTFVVRRPSK
ncbi:MAG: signal peptidase [Actinomycetota bacterium]|nr:signal peptidase [Actinomycetota bacterium]